MIDSILKKAIQLKIEDNDIDWIKVNSACLFSKENRLELELMLDGDSGPVTAEIGYDIADDWIVIGSVKTSKRWMTEVADLVLVKMGKKFALPSGLKGTILKALL